MNEPPDGGPPPGGGLPDDRKVIINDKCVILYKSTDLGPYQVMVESVNVKKSTVDVKKSTVDKNDVVDSEASASDSDNVPSQTKKDDNLHIGNYSHLKVAKTLLGMKLTDLVRFEKKGRNRLCVTFKSSQGANNLLTNKTLLNMRYSMFIPTNLISCKGVVRYVDVDLTEEEIKQYSSAFNINIIDVKRLNRRKVDNGVVTYVPTSSIRISFEGKILPKFVDIYSIPMPVQPYILPIVQCYNCLLYGHIQKNCNSKEKCKNCGLTTENRCVDCKVRCIHCLSESHTSVSNKCPEYSRQKQVREIMSLDNLSLFDANMRVPKPTTNTQYFSRTQEFPTLSPNSENTIPVSQRRNFLSQPTTTYSYVTSKKRKPSPMTPPPHSQPAPGFDLRAHNECLIYPNSRFPSSPNSSPVGYPVHDNSPLLNKNTTLSSAGTSSSAGQIDALLDIFSHLTKTEKNAVFVKIMNLLPAPQLTNNKPLSDAHE